MMKSLALFSMLSVMLSAPLHAQSGGEEGKEIEGPQRFWQVTFPDGHYMVALDRISSISRQTYLLDGVVVVHEINVDTNGQALARFYYIVPPDTPSSAANAIIQRGKQVSDEIAKRSNIDVQNMVTKKYPETTHAKCIEYRLLSQAEFDSLYKSLQSAWESGKGRKFTVREKP